MSLVRTLVLKEWSLHRDTVWDSVVFAVCGSLIAPWSTVVCLLVFCGLVAARVGARLGHDLRQFDTLEFMLTRPIDRRSFVRQRLAFGALPVALALGFVAVIRGFDLRSLALDAFAGAAPWLDREPSTIANPSGYAIAVAIVALVYVCAFEIGLTRSTLDSPANVAFEGAVRAALVAVSTWLLFYVAPNAIGLVLRRGPEVDSTAEAGSAVSSAFGPLAVLVLVVAAWFRVRSAERHVANYEASVGTSTNGTSSPAAWVVAVVVVVLVGALLFAWLLTPVLPSAAPSALPSNGGK
ncbi:MAG: hypothetical protein IT459_01310 [Planctomycetes bacterium]|nr:hypothetical protein [Planctomycetota bacterium]